MSSLLNLDWDSEFFQKKIGSLTYDLSFDRIENDLEKAKAEGYNFLYVFCQTAKPIEDIILSNFNGEKVDTKVIFTKDIPAEKAFKINDNISIAKGYSVSLERLAILSGSHSRFLKDPFFSKEQFENLYKMWLVNSLNGKLASQVLVYLKDSKEVGFVTVAIKGKVGSIGLIAVDKDFQGLGIGYELMIAAEQFLCAKNVLTMTVPTQIENQQACAFYTKLNFEISKIQNIYHFTL